MKCLTFSAFSKVRSSFSFQVESLLIMFLLHLFWKKEIMITGHASHGNCDLDFREVKEGELLKSIGGLYLKC